jgi:hypothetical protein
MHFIHWLFSNQSSIDIFGAEFYGPPIFIFLVLAVFIYSIYWIRKDARLRGKSPTVAMLFGILSGWPLSLLWWKWLRPTLIPKKPFSLDDYRQ